MMITANDIGPSFRHLKIKDCNTSQLLEAGVSPEEAVADPDRYVGVHVQLSLEDRQAIANEQNANIAFEQAPERDQEDAERKLNLTPKDRAIIVEMHKLVNRLQVLVNKSERPLNYYIQNVLDTYISIKNE